MSITKGKLADRVHKVLGVNTRTKEATPTEVADTINTINDWMLSNNGIGIRLGWVSNNDEAPDPDEESGIPDWAVQGVVYSCAEAVAMYFDKAYSPTVAQLAADGMQTILANTAYVKRVQYPGTMPVGSGNNLVYGPTYHKPSEGIQTNSDFLEDNGGDLILP